MCNNQFEKDNLILRLVLSQLKFLTCTEKTMIATEFTTVDDFLALSLDSLLLRIGRRIRTSLWVPGKLKHNALYDLRVMQTYKINVIFFDSFNYPQKLREIHDPPYALFYRGDISVLKNNCVAMVGTRHPSIQGVKSAKTIAQDLCIAGLTIVSGLAYGIDTQSHLGALCAQGSPHCGKTIAVLGSSVDNVTPSSNKRLAQSILASGGLIISEYSSSLEVQKYHFVQRNRIISALSLGTIVIEAPRGSGALITADFTLEHNRLLCFYKKNDTVAQKNTILEIKNLNNIKMAKKKNKRSVDDYIEEGAPTVESALDFLELLEL